MSLDTRAVQDTPIASVDAGKSAQPQLAHRVHSFAQSPALAAAAARSMLP